jgi:hypothetical protein
MIRRSGATLVEVLVAIFVTAIGLLALLALFPLGALTMDQAIKDARATQAAQNAAAIADALGIRQDPIVAFSPVLNADVFINPGTGVPQAGLSGPGYPVYVDPIGASISPTLGAVPAVSPGIPRRSTSFINGFADALRWFTLLDDIRFASSGTPIAVAPGVFEREGRWSWAYLLRRPEAGARSVVDASVVVYRSRSLSGISGEVTYPNITFDPTTTLVTVPYGGAQVKPTVRKGGWILDATLTRTVGNAVLPDPHGFFYRVVDVVDTSANSVTLELQTPPKVGALPNQGVLVVLDAVVEVFEMGPGRLP